MLSEIRKIVRVQIRFIHDRLGYDSPCIHRHRDRSVSDPRAGREVSTPLFHRGELSQMFLQQGQRLDKLVSQRIVIHSS